MNDSNTTVQLIAIVSGVIIPLLVALISKADASSGLKAVLNLGLSAIAGSLAQLAIPNTNWQSWILSFAITWGTSIVSYYGLHKPVGSAPAVTNATSSVGVG